MTYETKWVNLKTKIGATWDPTFTWYTDTTRTTRLAIPSDVIVQVSVGDKVLFTLKPGSGVTVDAPNGYVAPTLTPDQTAAVAEGKKHWFMQFTDATQNPPEVDFPFQGDLVFELP